MKIECIAEIGQAHDGSLGIAHSYIDALKGSGVDTIKWQVHIAEAESSRHEDFRKKFSYEDKTRFDYWQRMEFTKEQWKEIKDHCENAGFNFLASPFSIQAVDLLESIGCERYKVGSGEVSNLLLLEKLKMTGKPVILSSGLSDLDELKSSRALFDQDLDIPILQCTTAYPTPPEAWGLDGIKLLKENFGRKIGYSDHSGEPYACLAAAALGAEILEFHVVFDQRMFGPDSKASLSIDQTRFLVDGVRKLEMALDQKVEKSSAEIPIDLKTLFGKSLGLKNTIESGAIVGFDDLESKKPEGKGIPAKDFKVVIGKKVNREIQKGDFINWEDLDDE